MFHHIRYNRAFTLIELLVVIAIIGILAGFIIVSMNGASDAANDSRRKADINQLSKAVMIWRTDHSDIPLPISTGCDIGDDCVDIFGSASVLRDPAGIYYTYASDGNDFIINSLLSGGENYYFDSVTGMYHTSSSEPPVPGGAEDAICGVADGKIYGFIDTSFSDDTFCSSGTIAVAPDFPLPGNDIAWICAGENGGLDADCSASRSGLSGYSKRKVLDVTSTSSLINYQIKMTIAYDSDMQADFDDLRFASADGESLIDYWVESKTDSSTATVWVEVPSLSVGSNTIYMYYGNPTVSTASNPKNTFIFYEEFDGTSLPSGWVNNGLSSVTITGGYASLVANPSTWGTNTGLDYNGLNVSGNFELIGDFSWYSASSDLAIVYLGLNTNALYASMADSWSDSSGYYYIYCHTSNYTTGAATAPATGSFGVKMTREGSTVNIYQDGVQRCSGVFADNVTNIHLNNERYATYNGKIARFYNIRIRNFISAEPTISVGVEEAAF